MATSRSQGKRQVVVGVGLDEDLGCWIRTQMLSGNNTKIKTQKRLKLRSQRPDPWMQTKEPQLITAVVVVLQFLVDTSRH